MIGLDDHWFTNRPARTEPCTHCGGFGIVTRGYVLAPIDRVVGAPADAIRALVVGSSDIFTACAEAADIARRSGEPVAFEFIDHVVVVRPGSDPDKVARRWWKKQYPGDKFSPEVRRC